MVDSGSGTLIIQGSHVNNILVKATIRSDKYSELIDLQQAFENKMTLSLEPTGSNVTLKAMNKAKLFNFKSPNIHIDLEMTVPHEINILVDDGSGNITISDISGEVKVDDGSGSLLMNNIVGNVFIDDGSGSQVLVNIDGDIEIDDGSGSVEIKGVTGNVKIDDGSGSIKIEDLAGKFKLVDGGSGSIYVNGKKWNDKD